MELERKKAPKAEKKEKKMKRKLDCEEAQKKSRVAPKKENYEGRFGWKDRFEEFIFVMEKESNLIDTLFGYVKKWIERSFLEDAQNFLESLGKFSEKEEKWNSIFEIVLEKSQNHLFLKYGGYFDL